MRTIVASALLLVASIAEGTPLHLATAPGDVEVVNALLADGADPNARNDKGWTPLHIAAAYNSATDVISALLEAGAAPNAPGDDGWTPLHLAAHANTEPAVITALVAGGANVGPRDEHGWTPLHIAARHSSASDVITALLEAGAEPNARTDDGWTPLHLAAHANAESAVITALVAGGADVGARDEHGSTPLHLAAELNTEPAVIAALVAGGADVSATTDAGSTPLHQAAAHSSAHEVVAALLESGAEPNARLEDGATPLYAAARWNADPTIVAALVTGGADVRAHPTDGWTPMHAAAKFGSAPDVLAALLEAGADPFALTHQGQMPFAVAASFNKSPSIVEQMLMHHLFDVANPLSRVPFQLPQGLHRARCWFDDDTTWPRKSCFFMVVSEDPAAPDTRLVIFPVVKFFRGEGDTVNPFLLLGGGGPGNPVGLIDPNSIWLQWKNLVGNSGRDLYVIDPRGVGLAHPRLHCQEALDPIRESLSKAMIEREESEVWLSSYSICKQRIESQGHDLSQYNSRVVAQDVDLLRRALGIGKWVLLGNSYSSRYALTIARDFPYTVEAMVLNGAVFPNLPFVAQSATALTYAFSRAFARCENMGTCVASSMEERFWELASRLDNEPMVVDELPELTYAEPPERIALTGARLRGVVYQALYDADFFRDLPDLIGELERGWTGTLQEALRIYLDAYLDPTFSNAVASAHYCSEEHPFVDYDLEMRHAQARRDQISGMVEIAVSAAQSNCKIWDVTAAAALEHQAVESSIPVLFLQGALDPVVPIEYLGDQLRHFGHHAVLVFSDSSHLGSVYNPCAMRRAGVWVEHKQLIGERCPSESELADHN